jgi:Gpi18-like mannosyltransferase
MLPPSTASQPAGSAAPAADCASPSKALPLIAFAVDVLIAAYVVGLILIALGGGMEFGLFSVTGASKPLLVLCLLVPLRLTLGGRTWIAGFTERTLFRRTTVTLRDAIRRVHLPPVLIDVLFAVIVTRAATWTIAFLANVLLPPSRARTWDMPFEHHKFAEIFAAWDSGWYFDIARRGYYFNPDGQSSVAFFPLYPMAMRVIAWPFGDSDRTLWLAGIVISGISFVLALTAVHRLTERVCGSREIARRAVLYMAVFPFSLFFTRVYAESLFLLMSVLAVSSAYGGRWWKAGLWGAAATLTRPNGILVGIPLILLALHAPAPAREMVRRAAALLLVPAALAGYSAYVYLLSGNPLAWLAAQSEWGYSLGHPPWQQLLKMFDRLVDFGIYGYFFVSPLAPYRLFHGLVALMFLAVTPAIFRRIGAPLGTYVLVSLLVPLSGNALEGVGRYAAALFPAFMLVACVRSPRFQEAMLVGGSLFLALFVCLWVTQHPIY